MYRNRLLFNTFRRVLATASRQPAIQARAPLGVTNDPRSEFGLHQTRDGTVNSRFIRIACVLAGCVVTSATTCPADIPSRVPNGSWGGEHIRLIVTDNGAVIEYDCPAGTVIGPLLLDVFGHFDW